MIGFDITSIMSLLGPLVAVFLNVPLIQALVKIAREAGLPTRFAPLLAIAVGMFLGLIVAYIAIALALIGITPGILYIYGAFLGLLAGAGAAGFYDAAKFIKSEQTSSGL